ncbi:hypothetical protein BKA57DRAFT_29474 [Linnemannia elongata]|nr:hypothetical protein BKA57DRAFT_29474 [Linnemannia elongata]
MLVPLLSTFFFPLLLLSKAYTRRCCISSFVSPFSFLHFILAHSFVLFLFILIHSFSIFTFLSLSLYSLLLFFYILVSSSHFTPTKQEQKNSNQKHPTCLRTWGPWDSIIQLTNQLYLSSRIKLRVETIFRYQFSLIHTTPPVHSRCSFSIPFFSVIKEQEKK